MRTRKALLLVGLGVCAAVVLAAGVWTLSHPGAPLHKLWLVSRLGDPAGSRGRRTHVEIDPSSILAAARAFHGENGRWPESIQELTEPDAPSSPGLGPCNVDLDPWGNPYLYEIAAGAPRVACLGSDGQPGGEGEAADSIFP